MKKKQSWKITQKYMTTYTKRLVTIVVGLSLLDVQVCIILLPLLDKQIPETLCVAIVTEILGVIVGYFIKAFKETERAEDIKLRRDRMNLSAENESTECENIEENTVEGN